MRCSDKFAVWNWMDLPFDGWRWSKYLLMRCDEWQTPCAFVQCGFDWKGSCRRRRRHCRQPHLPSIPQNRRIQQMFASWPCTPATSAWSTLILPLFSYAHFLCVSLHNRHIKSKIKYIYSLCTCIRCGIDGRWSWMHFWFACDLHSMGRLTSTCNETKWRKWS